MTSTGKEEYIPTSMVEVLGTIWVRRLEYLAMMPMTVSTLSSSTPEMKVVLPAIKKPPVVANFVTEKPSRVMAEETAPLSSLLTIARISFIKKYLPFLARPVFPPSRIKICRVPVPIGKHGVPLGLFYH